MTNVEQGPRARSEVVLEDLLRSAGPRPAPRREDRDRVRASVRAEWQVVAGKHRRRRLALQYAVAAGVVIVAFSFFNLFRLPEATAVDVATIDRSYGSIYLLGEQSELHETGDLANLVSGQILVTGPDSGLAITWGSGGSLRVDERTRIEFVSETAVRLHSGRVYFDSISPMPLPVASRAGAGSLVVQTPHGDVSHRGTQFMTRVDGEALAVTVREGSVEVDGRFHRRTARAGEQVTFVGRARPAVLSVPSSGSTWAWVSRTTPSVDFDGRSLHEFLTWACRELGLELRFDGDTERIAHEAILHGTVDTEPARALRLRLASVAMAWEIDGGTLTISETR